MHDISVPALRADRVGKRYGRVWGLRDCSFAVPAGSVVGLVGPNGAGKTTLLSLAVGLLAPTTGQLAAFGHWSRAHSADTLGRVSYLAQDRPLYRGFTVADMFHLGRSMNPSWDQALARARVRGLGIALERKVKDLSGGQQAQVSLTMALAKRAPLLVLDEPVASLDPVARLEFMKDVMSATAEGGLTVVIASHVISELERLCDWLLVLTSGRLQLAGPVDDLLAAHRLLTVPRPTAAAELPGMTVSREDSDRHSTVLVASGAAARPGWPALTGHQEWRAEPVSFEQLVLAYLRRPAPAGQDAAAAAHDLAPVGGTGAAGPAGKAIGR